MIAMTVKNGVSVRLDVDYNLSTMTAEYTVSCNGTRFMFPDFKQAACVYKTLSARVENGEDVTFAIRNFVKAARLFGNSVITKDVA